ncbi:hypothetical protein A9975_01145 [Cupriavidus sp. UME77]|nr:hypothetical protein [Cupriavidus sp. UME77]
MVRVEQQIKGLCPHTSDSVVHFLVGIHELSKQFHENDAFLRRQWLNQELLRAVYVFLQIIDQF